MLIFLLLPFIYPSLLTMRLVVVFTPPLVLELLKNPLISRYFPLVPRLSIPFFTLPEGIPSHLFFRLISAAHQSICWHQSLSVGLKRHLINSYLISQTLVLSVLMQQSVTYPYLYNTIPKLIVTDR